MNKRIQEFAEQAGFYYTDKTGFITPAGCDPAKFAELIVRECAELSADNAGYNGLNIFDKILKHFGVEE